MEYSYRCRADYLQVFDGMFGEENWNNTGRFCLRSHAGRTLISSGNVMKLKFRTDRSITRRGFKVKVQASKYHDRSELENKEKDSDCFVHSLRQLLVGPARTADFSELSRKLSSKFELPMEHPCLSLIHI